jgi:hypothetical protein
MLADTPRIHFVSQVGKQIGGRLEGQQFHSHPDWGLRWGFRVFLAVVCQECFDFASLRLFLQLVD